MATNGTVNGRSDPERLKFETDLIKLMPFARAFSRSLAGTPEAGEDLAQQAFLHAWKARDQFTPDTNLKAWLFTIIRNIYYSDRRRAWRWQEYDPEVAEKTLTTEGDVSEAEAKEELRRLLRCLCCLSQEQADALIAVGYLGMSYEEAGTALRCATGTVKSRVARGRKELLHLIDYATIDNANISELQKAAEGVPRHHPYFRIARAYSELFAEFSGQPQKNGASKDPSSVEDHWRALVSSGALDEEKNLEDLMRFDADTF